MSEANGHPEGNGHPGANGHAKKRRLGQGAAGRHRDFTDPRKAVFSTGEIATITKVSCRTAAKWIDAGRLKGYRIPGSEDRRVGREELIRFLRDNGMPLYGLVPSDVLLAVYTPATVPAEFERASPFEAGCRAAERDVGGILVGCVDGLQAATEFGRTVRDRFPRLPLALVVGEDRSPESVAAVAFDFVFPHGADPAAVLDFFTTFVREG